MKLIALAAALALSGTAIAQTAPAVDPAPPQQATPAPPPEQPVTTVTTTTDAAGTPSTTVDVASPGNYTPPPAPDPASSYPPCSRTVTDHCRQRGGR